MINWCKELSVGLCAQANGNHFIVFGMIKRILDLGEFR